MGGFMGGGKPDTSAAEESLRLQREQTAIAEKKALDEKRDYQEQIASRRKAAQRGGARMLLAESRLTPETGIDETLGTTIRG